MRDLRIRDLIIGTMKSAKSANLILKGFQLDLQGKKVLTFAPEMNTRDGAFISSRALPHLKRPAIVVPTDNNGSMISNLIWARQPDVILIDELQFFTVEQVERIAEISITYDVDIYAYGLLMSYTGRMFEPIKRALECAFNMKTLDMSCDHCANDATHHLYYVDDELITEGSGVAVEDEEFEKKSKRYESVCFSCYHKALDVAEMDKVEKDNEILKSIDDAISTAVSFRDKYDAPF